MTNWTPQSWLVGGGRTRTPGDPLNVSPELASNFYLPDERLYSRTHGTTTTDALEELVGGLEKGSALAFASGMAAAAAVFGRLPVGARIAAFFDHHLAGEGAQPANGVTALTQTCPTTAPSARG